MVGSREPYYQYFVHFLRPVVLETLIEVIFILCISLVLSDERERGFKEFGLVNYSDVFIITLY